VRHLGVGEKHIHIQGADPAGRPYTSTHGQMAEYGTLTDYAAMQEDGLAVPAGAPLKPSRLPDDFDLVDAGVLLPLCECLSAVKNFGIDGGTDVLVYGAGPMGLAMMRYMRILGARSITCIDSVPERLEKALRAGVDRAIDYAQVSVDEALNGQLFDRVVDAVGLSAVIMEGTRRLRPYGVVCSLGVLRKNDGLVNLSLLKNNTSVHMLNFPYGEYDVLDENLGYIRAGLIDPRDYYSHVMPVDDVAKALELVLKKQTIKVILTFTG